MVIQHYSKKKNNKKIKKKKLNEITSGNPKHKSNSQLYVIENVKIFRAQEKQLLIY